MSMALLPPDPKFILRGARAEINSLQFFCGNQEQGPPILFSGASNGLIHVWNLKIRRADTVLDGHDGKSVYWVQTLRGRESLLSQGRDLQICTWDLAEGRNTVTDSLFTESVGFCKCSLLRMSQDRWLLAVAGRETSEVQVREMPSQKLVCTLTPESEARMGMPMCLRLWQPPSGSSPLLLVGYEDGSLALWSIAEKRPLSRLPCHQDPVMCLDFDPERARGVSGSSDKAPSAWRLDAQQRLQVYKSLTLTNPGVADVAIRQDGRILATGGWDHRLRIFGWKSLKPLAVLDYHTATVHCVTFSDHDTPSDRLMAAGSKDQRISLWSLYNEA
ncbi:guanine nucleotide-binding protein subunit beta-like protein 1 isoform X2 [Pleurodeles waltl]|uniref:guanine nucleotide-binding protein subunit beta-like protein 1 isoform X2 n=1 Tax=Pleurodeles waltl TaxID=8319 RepID=UPI0037098BA3